MSLRQFINFKIVDIDFDLESKPLHHLKVHEKFALKEMCACIFFLFQSFQCCNCIYQFELAI